MVWSESEGAGALPMGRFDIRAWGHDVGFLFGGVVMAKLGIIVLQAPNLPL